MSYHPLKKIGSPIYILCPDLNLPSGGIKRLYRIAGILYEAGFNACILHEKTGFHQDWLDERAPIRYADGVTLDPEDIVVIPETLPDIMKRIPNYCRKVVHAFSWTYIFQNLREGESWRDYHIEMVLTPSRVIADFIQWSMGIPVHRFDVGIDHELFAYRPEEKEEIISFLAHRNPEGIWIRKIFAQIPGNRPPYRWIAISDMNEGEYARTLRKSKIFIATGIREGVPGPILEALCSGCVVVGYRGVGGNEYLVNEGPKKNFFGVENGDYFGLSRSLETLINLICMDDPLVAQVIQNGLRTVKDLTYDREAESIIGFWEEFTKKKVAIRNPPHHTKPDPSLSLCMIVKDEEELLPGCLKSIQDYVDEIIVVDTGSSDRSIEIAEQFGAKVFRHPWSNDFAGHRNQSISYASGDWILIMDADEEFVPSGGDILKKALQEDGIDSIAIQVINPVNDGKESSLFNSIRAFRNNGKIRYEGAVHNRVVGQTTTRFYPARVIHHGYNLDAGKMKAKFERTSSLLNDLIAKDYDNPLPHHYLAVGYMNMGPDNPVYYTRAIEEGSLAIQLSSVKGTKDLTYLGSHYVVAASHFNLGNLPKAEEICKKALEIYPHHLDSYFLLAKVYEQGSRYREALDCAERFLTIRKDIDKHPEKFGMIINQNFSNQWLIRIIQGKAEYECGALGISGKIFREVGGDHPNHWKAQALIGDFYFKKSEYRDAAYFLRNANEIRKERLFLYMLCECYGHIDDEEAQIEVLSEIMDLFPEDIENLKQIGLNQIRKSRFKVASFCLSMALEKGDRSPEVLHHLREANLAIRSQAKGISPSFDLQQERAPGS